MDEREHLPPAPLGYRWEVDIRLEEEYGAVNLVPNSWSHLNPGQGCGHGQHLPPGTTREEAYRELVRRAWIGVDVQREVDRIAKALEESEQRARERVKRQA
jgi:hypothetical protein